jgi:coatomer protein complex subunit alpha (xenin)
MYSRGIELTTKGDFNSALVAFRHSLQSVPLLVLPNELALKEAQGLIGRLLEYITAIRIELERKRLIASGNDEVVRATELSCYMTLCAMDNAHKFLAYRNAMQSNYKANNFITASHFTRLILDLEPTGIFAQKPEVIAQHKKYFQAFQAKGMNAFKLNFNQNLNVELQRITEYLCLGSLSPLEDSRPTMVVKCPLCESVQSKTFEGQVCQTCELCVLGEDVVGLQLVVQ